MKYRAEIDGLRALAVLPVIFFHAGFEIFSGGYVGVDIFFVISGYLITSIIISEMSKEKFSIINFYERRARRILPALFLVMFVCIPFAYIFLLPEQLNVFGQSLFSVSLFISNIQFWLGSGYFAEGQENNPLLHTWSLAVEEQFYIFFPILLILTWKLGLKKLVTILVLIFITSFAIANWAVFYGWHQKISSGAFFLIPARAWELMAGSFVAIYLTFFGKQLTGWKSQLSSWIGIFLIFCAIFLFDESTPFPSYHTLLPVLGTVLLILSNAKSFVHKVFKLPIMVSVGLISYSAYLWHQPIFAFSKIYSEALSEIAYLFLILLSMSLAYLSWRFIEAPFRNRKITSRRFIFQFSAIGIFSFSLLGIWFSSTNGFEYRSPNYQILNKKTEWPTIFNKTEDCLSKFGGDQYCLISNSDKKPTHLLLGDSHANHFFYGLSELLKNSNESNLLMTGAGGCPPLLDIDMGWGHGAGADLKCHKRTHEHYKKLVNQNGIQHIFLSFNEGYLFDLKNNPIDLRGELDFKRNRYDAIKSALKRTMNEWSIGETRVWLIEDLPDVSWGNYERCVWEKNSFNDCKAFLTMEPQLNLYVQLLDDLEKEGFHIIRTSQRFKDTDLTTKDGSNLIFRDYTHLTKYGSLKAFENLLLN